jgi:hypothetical protein
MKVLGLGQLLGGAVQQADVRIGALDDFAVELEHQAQHAVGRGMLRPEVERVVLDFSHGANQQAAGLFPASVFVFTDDARDDLARLDGDRLVHHARRSAS